MNEKLSEAQTRIMMCLEENGALTYNEIAELTGLSYDGVRGRVSELSQLGIDLERGKNGVHTVVKYKPKKTKKVVGRKFSKPRTYGDMVGARLRSTEDFYGVTEFLEQVHRIKPTTKAVPLVEPDEHAGFLVLSDLHFGEIQKVGGVTTYDTAIANERVDVLTDKIVAVCEEYGIEYLTIGMIGDIIDGDMIYKNHMFHVEKPAIEQVQDAVAAMTRMFKTLAAADIFVDVHCVRGNHGITNYKNLEMDNWDNVAYDMLSLVFDKADMVDITHYREDEAKVDFAGREVVLYHGNDMSSQCKTASGLKMFRGMCQKHRLEENDIIVVGHLHEFGVETDQGRILIRNGALPDASEYALRHNLDSIPCQVLMLATEENNYPIIMPLEVK